MSKYINADELKEKLRCWELTDVFAIIEEKIDEMPSADIRENVHGKWIRTNPLTDTLECSLCGMQIPVPEMCSPFCPLCGADMRERKETNE